MHFNKKFSLDVDGYIEEIKNTEAENSGKTRLPAASRIFLANQRRAGDETKGQ